MKDRNTGIQVKSIAALSVALVLFGASASAAAHSASSGQAQPHPGQASNASPAWTLPNVLFIMVDDLRPELHCYGENQIISPNIDRLASRGVVFTRAYCQEAICMSSRNSLLSGCRPDTTKIWKNGDVRERLSHIDFLLAHFKNHGYYTAGMGKIFHSEWFDENSWVEPNWKPENAPYECRTKAGRALVDKIRQDAIAAGKPDPYEGIPTKIWRGMPYESLDVEDAGNADDTLIIFLGDHGPPFTRGKTTCYEAGLRVPFLARWPGVSEAHVSDRLVSSADIHPTILDAAGINIPAGLHGRSLRPVLKPAVKTDWRDTLVGEFHFHNGAPFFPRRAITDGRFKLIHNLLAGEAIASSGIGGDTSWELAQTLPESDPVRKTMDRPTDPPEWELYDLQDDPNEFQNHAGEAALGETESRLKTELAAWQEDTKDPFADPKFLREMQAEYTAQK